MVKYAIMHKNNITVDFVRSTLYSIKRYEFVPTIEKAELFKNKEIANNVLNSIKFKNINDFNNCKLVEVEITFTLKEIE